MALASGDPEPKIGINTNRSLPNSSLRSHLKTVPLFRRQDLRASPTPSLLRRGDELPHLVLARVVPVEPRLLGDHEVVLGLPRPRCVVAPASEAANAAGRDLHRAGVPPAEAQPERLR